MTSTSRFWWSCTTASFTCVPGACRATRRGRSSECGTSCPSTDDDHVARLGSRPSPPGSPAPPPRRARRARGRGPSALARSSSMPWMTTPSRPRATCPVARSCGSDVANRVDRDREADALALRVDRRVDADHLAAQIEERPAAVAGVDARVGLDEVVVRPGADGPALGADDAHRHRVAEAERVADRHDVLADAQRLARAERRDRQVVRGVLAA